MAKKAISSPKRNIVGRTKRTKTARRSPLQNFAKGNEQPELVQVVLAATRKTPRSVAELLQHLQKAKHKFATGNPDKELKRALKLSPALKDYGGKFGPSFGR